MKKFIKNLLMSSLVLAAAVSPISATRALAHDGDQGNHDEEGSKPTQTIVGVALSINAKTGEFSTLIAALQAAGLVDALNGKGHFTVFAPTDAAFAKLPAGTIQYLVAHPDVLKGILLYHVAPRELFAEDVVESHRIRMLDKQFVKVTVKRSGVFINDAKILITDVEATNGVIHVIDTVLIPK